MEFDYRPSSTKRAQEEEYCCESERMKFSQHCRNNCFLFSNNDYGCYDDDDIMYFFPYSVKNHKNSIWGHHSIETQEEQQRNSIMI